MLASACEPPPRSTGTMPALAMHQPKIGIHISSRLTMKVKSSNSHSSANVSQVDWCLAATISGPLGSFSRPRNSTFVPQITRSSHTLMRPHSVAMPSTARRGITSVSERDQQQHAEVQVEQHVEDDGADDDHVGATTARQKKRAGSEIEPMADPGQRDTSDIPRTESCAVDGLFHQTLDPDLIRDHGIGHQRDVRKLMASSASARGM